MYGVNFAIKFSNQIPTFLYSVRGAALPAVATALASIVVVVGSKSFREKMGKRKVH